MERRILVGIDGSEPAVAALRWAAAEAARHRAELEVVVAYHWRVPGTSLRSGEEVQRAADEAAGDLAAAACGIAQEVAPDLTVRCTALLGDPVPVLLRSARDADLLVLGHRGREGFAGLLLGSVGLRMAAHSPGPVVVVRGRADHAAGPVVVGLDGSPASEAAAQLAFTEAAVRDDALVAVTAYPGLGRSWLIPSADPAGGEPGGQPGAEPGGGDSGGDGARGVERELTERLTGQLAAWRDKYPAVPVREIVVRGGAAGTLVQLSRGAGLVVVGSRGHGALHGMLLGSVGLQLLHHADCPVLIARTR
jgi:nucleotide-binding universal stress UspA family protein